MSTSEFDFSSFVLFCNVNESADVLVFLILSKIAKL